MLTENEKQNLAQAVDGLKDGPWRGLAPLAALARDGAEISIDFSTQDLIGAPVIVVNRKTAPPPQVLSPRQAEVCQLIAKGLSNKAIASTLGISPATVKDHVHAVLDRLGLQSRAEVAAYLHRMED